MPNTKLDRGFTSTGGKPVNRSFAEKLAAATNEDKQVNPIYVQAISKGLKKENASMDADRPVYSGYTDGLFECSYYGENGDVPFLLQLECKQDVDLNDSEQFAKVMLQVFYYIKQFDRAKERLPKVIVLGTKINCLTIATESFFDNYIKGQSYPETDERGNKISASTAPFNPLYQPLLHRIRDDAALHTKFRVIEVTDKNAVSELCKDIVKLAKDIGLKEDIDVSTLVRAFDFFDMKVLSDKSRKSLGTREKVAAFMQVILNPNLIQADVTVDVLGNKKYSDTWNFNGVYITVDPSKFNSFANLFSLKNRQLVEAKSLTAVQDQLIEDLDRRRKGDFYTPSIWVDEAHKLMDKNLGPNWRKESIVWDCAWGTGNLTRDKTDFRNLYCSTLYEEDIKTGEMYNPFAAKFQYDFLNDDVNLFQIVLDTLWSPFIGTRFYGSSLIKDKMNFRDVSDVYAQAVEACVTTEEKCRQAMQKAVELMHQSKLHLLGRNSTAGAASKSLIDELLESSQAGENGRPLVFFINPPYGTSGEMGGIHGTEHKAGVGYSAVNSLMLEEKIGTCSRQLVAQFVYRINLIQKLFGVNVKLGMFSPTSVLTSNDYAGLLSKVDYHLGYTDGFMFCASEFADVQPNWGIMFSLYSSNNTEHARKQQIKVRSLDDDFESFDKTLYALDKSEKASWWTKEPIENCKKTRDVCYLKSALNTNTAKEHNMAIEQGIGGFLCNANIVDNNAQFVALLSSMSGQAIALNIGKQNFDRVISLFTARKLITGPYATWINCKDEYIIPNTEHPDYAQWQADCIVYSLFNTASNQSSLRNIDYNGKTWNIFNEFFWMSREEIYSLATGSSSPDTLAPAVANDVLKYGQSGNRFVYEKLQTVHLSDDAKLVLDMATAILIDTMKYREEFDRKHPEYHINSWDAGWYQVKAVAKEYIPDKLKIFNELYKKLEDRMRPLVYELGFLYK